MSASSSKKVVQTTSPTASSEAIRIEGARQNNLKGFDLNLPLGKLNVITGPSGSGKSSLAFDTIYAEGQRRYVETFSPYTRQFFDRMDKPQVDAIHGIPPAIAIEQVNQVRTTRSTVGTITEINDYLKLLFPRLAVGLCPCCGEPIRPETSESILQQAFEKHAGENVTLMFGVAVPQGSEVSDFFAFLQSQGYVRVRIYEETFRTDEPESFGSKKLPAVVDVIQDRVKLEDAQRARLHESLEAALRYGKGTVSLLFGTTKTAQPFSTDWRCASCDYRLPEPSPGLFNFNSPIGACPKCRGFGKTLSLDMDKAMPDKSLSIERGVVKAFSGEMHQECQRDLMKAAKKRGVKTDVPFLKLPAKDQQWVIDGVEGDVDELHDRGEWYGVKGFFKWLEGRAYKMHVRVFLSRYRAYTTCPDCDGGRLKPEAFHFQLQGKTLRDLWKTPVSDLLRFLDSLKVSEGDRATQMILTDVRSRLNYMQHAGLGYLDLDRQTRTLSGGELQRVNLTTCLGASLVNTLFVLDEPSIGLHPRDIHKLIGVMEGLRDKGNTLLVVEHEEAVMHAADHLIEIGPGRGEEGGHVVFEGPFSQLSEAKNSLTSDYVLGRKEIEMPKKRRRPKKGYEIQVKGAAQHNLKDLDVNFPLGIFCALTGVSGSGKSTLVHDILYRHLMQQRGATLEEAPGLALSVKGGDQVRSVVMVDQSPLAKTPRSTPALYIGAYDAIRQLFADSEDGKAAGINAGYFSFNTGDGRCPRCMGNGLEKIEMQFLSDLYLTCPECEGKRFQLTALKIKLEGKSIHDVLSMTFTQAVEFFSIFPSKKVQNAVKGMKLLCETGLGYLRLGQPLNTLSGGEAQRLKLISHLMDPKSQSEKAFFLLDEPTTGLHFDDIALLVKLMQRLVDEGHSLLVIEHNLEVIRCADWIIDLGPEAGSEGGSLVVAGTPEQVADTPGSWTGKYLREALRGRDSKLILAEQAERYGTHAPSDVKAKNAISIHGAREHNLKNLHLDIPRDEMVVVTGLSGSGKSSLAFDLVFAEGQRRFLDSMSVYARTFAEQMEKPEVDLITGVPPTVAIEQRVSRGSGKSTVSTVTEVYHFLRLLYSKVGTQFCPCCRVPVEKQSAAAITTQLEKLSAKQSIKIFAPLIKARKGYHTDVAEHALKQGVEWLWVDGELKSTENFERLERFKEHHIDALIHQAPKGSNSLELKAHVDRAIKMGKGNLKVMLPNQKSLVFNTEMSCPNCGRSFEELDPRLFSFNSPHGWCTTCRGFGIHKKKGGLRKLRDDVSQLEAEIEEERDFRGGKDEDWVGCTTCHGSRLNEVARAVEVQGIPLEQISELSAERAAELVASFRFEGFDAEIARDILAEIQQRLKFMKEVGLSYLQLNRGADTLSGGEAQRIRLAAQLGSNLRGVLYVLDEPTIGLHPRDNVKLLDTLQALKNKGNSLLVVEHDEDTMHRADTIIDLGPGAGRFGGEVIAKGNLSQILKHPHSVTGQALREPMQHPLRGKRRKLPKKQDTEAWLQVEGASANNLKDIDVAIPLERLTVLTGISGSGKSSFMRAVLHPAVKQALAKIGKKSKTETFWKAIHGAQHFAAVYEVDQSPIGKSSRSCPATYVGILDDIRKLFAQLPASRARGFDASRFSFNVEGGRCDTCQGNGEIKVEMNFLPTTRIHCESCRGMRFNAATQEVLYHGKNIGQVLKMSLQEASEFFEAVPRLARPLQLLTDTGLGYLQLGQPSPTLSGGEAQRMKLVTELSVGQGRTITEKMKGLKNLKKNLYLIEEPTIGLHANDVRRLIDVLHRLVDEGHTVVVIEHELHVIAEADYLVDIGPEAGERGGKVVASGTPEQLIKSKASQTAPFLAKML